MQIRKELNMQNTLEMLWNGAPKYRYLEVIVLRF